MKLHHVVNRESPARKPDSEDDAFSTAQASAQARAIKLGQAVSELIRRKSAEKMPFRQMGGVWVSF